MLALPKSGGNWLPITREDLDIDVIMRVYQPDQKKDEDLDGTQGRVGEMSKMHVGLGENKTGGTSQ